MCVGDPAQRRRARDDDPYVAEALLYRNAQSFTLRRAIRERAEQPVEQPIGKLRLNGRRHISARRIEIDLGTVSARNFPKLGDLPIDKSAEIYPLTGSARCGMNFRGEIEVVDRRQQLPRLAHDFSRTVAIAPVCRSQILVLDDLREPDDRVQRSLDLVDEL